MKTFHYIKLKIDLRYTDISRTIVVPDSWTLAKLNAAIQAVFGWQNSHLWEFTRGRDERYGMPETFDEPDPFDMPKLRSAKNVRISDVLTSKGDKITYAYDFGDGWEHTVTRMADPANAKMACVKSTGVLCIEDIGGPGSLMEFIDALREFQKDPTKKPRGMFKETFDWLGCKDAVTRGSILSEPTLAYLTKELLAANR